MRGCGLSRHADVERWCLWSVSSWEGLHCVIYTFFLIQANYSGGLCTRFHTFSSAHGDAGAQQILRCESKVAGGSPKKNKHIHTRLVIKTVK